MKTITVYNPAELKELDSDAFEKAHEQYISDQCDVPWNDEIMDSFKAIFKASNIDIKDYNIDGNYPGSSNVKFTFYDEYSSNAFESEIGDLSGNRALAWLENNLLSDLRIKDNSLIKYNKGYRKGIHPYSIGQIKPCPFTGYCADDDFIESLIKAIKDGDTLGDAYSNLAFVAGKMFESEIEYMNSEEHFLEQDHLTITENGEFV